MLKNYEVCNFKSFKNNTKFSLERTNYQTLADTNLNRNILKGLLFVGANASGKSNALIAIKFLLDCLFGQTNIDMYPYMCLFSDSRIMSLKYTFDIEGSELIYIIRYQSIDDKLNEDLYVDGKHVIMRDGSVATTRFDKETNYTDVHKDMLFLRDVYFNTRFRGWDKLQKWFDYLSNSIYLDLYTRKAVQYKNIDISLHAYLEENGLDEINEFFQEFNFEQTVEYDSRFVGSFAAMKSDERLLLFKRKGMEGHIPYHLESLGNQTLLQLLPLFFYTIHNGGMLLLDEFSSGFHNNLEELLVRYFMKRTKEAQLILVSHSTNLLSTSILRPDQIYSVSFCGNEGSVIKRFSSERPREAQNLEKMYLSGVFHGVPQYEYKFE